MRYVLVGRGRIGAEQRGGDRIRTARHVDVVGVVGVRHPHAEIAAPAIASDIRHRIDGSVAFLHLELARPRAEARCAMRQVKGIKRAWIAAFELT